MELREPLPQAGISIKEVLPDCQIFGAHDVRVTSCCHDWNQLQAGDLYVAKVGMEKDGHDHIRIAAKKGAAAILSERFVVSDVPVCLVDDTRVAYGQICQLLAGNPKDQLKLVGVTGTDGKTIVCRIIQKMFQQAGMRTGVISSLGFCDGFVNNPSKETTPHAGDLAAQLSELVANNCQAGILEISSVGIAERRLAGIELDACVFTNIRKDHLDYHGTVDNYRRIKTRLVQQLKPDGFAVLNADDKFLNRWSQQVTSPALTYGIREDAEVTAEVLEQLPGEQTFLVTAGNETVPVRTRIVGDFYIRHCLAAASLGLTLGLQLEDVVAGIEAVESVPGRMERVPCDHDFEIYVDAAQTPHQLYGMLKSLGRTETNGQIRCVFSGSERTSAEQRAGLGTVAERYSNQPVIAGGDSKHQSGMEIAHDILDGFDNVSKAHFVPNRAAAIRHVLDSAQSGDKVLIAGRGELPTQYGLHDEFPLTDRELCELWVENPAALDSLCTYYDENLPISYNIENYR